ncbi:unnamed protein product [Clonostachys byssicola]|uniref:Hybrid signal transduction histidine kinase K n=1 Tax=Clonostachys byssicola TaxID=160290 RepID=A0A9N9UQR1_9HYPO|nr:unnamed protein product [Clonostachys byssicola]
MASSLKDASLVGLLDSDPRPTFIVANQKPGSTAPKGSGDQPKGIIYHNPALSSNSTLLQAILAIPEDEIQSPFWNWVNSAVPETRDLKPDAHHSLSYLGVYWTKNVVQSQWIVMSGNEAPPSSEPPRKKRLKVMEGISRIHHSEPVSTQAVDFAPMDKQELESAAAIPLFRDKPQPMLMLPNFSSDLEPFLDVIQSVDWARHSLGPMNSWPMRLQEAFNQTISDSRPSSILWGPEYLMLYNEAFSKFVGTDHPHALGRSVLEIWPEIKDKLDPVWNAPPNKRCRLEDETRFFVPKSDDLKEETYVKWALNPIVEGRCLGIQHSVLETTSMRLWERRMKMLIDLGNALVTAKDVQSYWAKTLEELERWSPAYDVPLAFIYSVVDDDDLDSSRSRYDCPRTCKLAGSLGVPAGHPIAPSILDLRDTDDGLAPSFREALQAQVALLLQKKDGTLPERLLDGLEWRGFGDACQNAVICPIRPTNDESIMGILFLGLNPRRPYDNDYRQFISLLHQKLTSSLASTVLLEEEARRGRNAVAQATHDTAMLQRKLAWQTEQTNKSLQNFEAVAEFIPVGMSITDNHGNVTFANDAWYRITGYPRGPIAPEALQTCVIPEDRSKIVRAYEELEKVETVTFEFRIPRTEPQLNGSRPRNGSVAGIDDRVGRHVLASTKAERADDGRVIRMLTCLTDVTEQKDTAEEAVRRAQEAQNLKRLAEFATVGMYDISLDGRLLSANNSFWELSGLPKVDLAKVDLDPWQTCVVEEDLPIVQQKLNELRASGRSQSAEIRLKTTWRAENTIGQGIESARSVLTTFIPVKSSDGVIQSFTGCISDVSLQKWQLDQERKRKDEAIESKRQQENFIDMTSHEMRNPLSAIVHCADAIVASLARVEELDEVAEPMTPSRATTGLSQSQSEEQERVSQMKRLIKDSIENAETIETCAQHQKRIVDDILTMSKLDSKLLAVTPCTVDPIHIVADALKMFDVEARRVDIALTSVVDPSYTDLDHKYLDLDPSRLKQILINLLTNALKFTKSGKVRNVTISVKGSLFQPGRDMTIADFIPRFQNEVDDYEQPALKGRGNPVYLLFEVKDTGQGLTEAEMGTLFNKFVQASAKTHVKYGGSGLGLFISRRLTELQNGAIGVSSEVGVGSTFAFYIEAYVPTPEALVEAEATAAAAKVVNRLEAERSGVTLESGGKQGATLKENRLHKKVQLGIAVRLDGILVVEDNLINQQITRRGLQDRGYLVDVANHGVEALEKLRKSVGAKAKAPGQGETTVKALSGGSRSNNRGSFSGSNNAQPIPINLVLMDIEMPILDGLSCTRQIRELEQDGSVFCASGGRIPIIAVTANARPEQIMEAKQAGCDDVLVKPYRIPELVEKMQVVVRRIVGLSPNSPAA